MAAALVFFLLVGLMTKSDVERVLSWLVAAILAFLMAVGVGS